MIDTIGIIVSAFNAKIDKTRLEIAGLSFSIKGAVFVFEFGHGGELIELKLQTDMSMIADDMSAEEISAQVNWLYADAKDKYMGFVFNGR